jgi:hypothetical protein
LAFAAVNNPQRYRQIVGTPIIIAKTASSDKLGNISAHPIFIKPICRYLSLG